MIISWSDFEKVDIRVGTIVKAEPFPKARTPAYKLWIDFGPLGVKKSSAQVTKRYPLESLAGKQVLAVVNFEPKQVADFMSECLTLGVVPVKGDVVLAGLDEAVENGLKLC